jgi:hypothetical protein
MMGFRWLGGSHIFQLNELASLVRAQAICTRILHQARVHDLHLGFILSIVVLISLFDYLFIAMCYT